MSDSGQFERDEPRDPFLALIDTIPQIAWLAGPDGRVTFFNARWAEYIGGSADAAAREDWAERLHPDDRERVREAYREALAASRAFELQFRLRHHDGSYRWHLARGVPARAADGRVTSWSGTATDIEDARRAAGERATLLAREQAARAEAEAANRLKDEFLATLSHELRTPLSAILGWATMLRSGKQGDAEAVARGAEVIERNARAQHRIIEDILDMSRIVRGELRIDTEPVDLHALACEVIETVRPSAEARSIALRCSAGPGPFHLIGDPARLRQMLWNLLGNAIKFTSADGEVVLRLDRVGDEFALSVRDTGCGIEPEFLPHVFERFRQADSSTTRVYGGLGLGLAIVRYLVQMHGGSVQASSAGPGQGATFRVLIPARA